MKKIIKFLEVTAYLSNQNVYTNTVKKFPTVILNEILFQKYNMNITLKYYSDQFLKSQ